MDTHFTLKNAAKILNTTLEEFNELLKKGILPVITIDGNDYVSAQDVHSLREILDSGKSPLTLKDQLLGITARVRRLEVTMERLCKVTETGMSVSLSSLPDEKLYQLYVDAMSELKRDSWSRGAVHKWASIFLVVDHVQFTRLAAITENEHPWKVFADLCKILTTWWAANGLSEVNAFGSEVAYLLDKGLKNLKKETLFYVENRPKDPYSAVLNYFTLPPEDKVKIFLKLLKNPKFVPAS